MNARAALSQARLDFHAALLRDVLRVTANGHPNNADTKNSLSIALATHVLGLLGKATSGHIPGQTAGDRFEHCCEQFLNSTFPLFAHIRPGSWVIDRKGPLGAVGSKGIAKFEQYEHLVAIRQAAEGDSALAAALGTDYIIQPDIMVYRTPLEDHEINVSTVLIDGASAKLSSLRRANQTRALLHASVSCKWTIRSDRSQNARSEALNLIRNRKGRVPHAVVVTAEPMPSRIASIALGTGDLDCVYHFALDELREAVRAYGNEDSVELLSTMIDGKRLRDISDLPLDLAV